VTASSVENLGTSLASARRLVVDHHVVAQEEEAVDEVEAVVADPADLATTAANLDTCLATALRKEQPQTPVHATTATRPVICPGTAQQVEVVGRVVVKNLASATNVGRRATCPVTAQVPLHNLHHPPIDATSATHVVRRITLRATVRRRAAVVVRAT
jgi:hypothetical protein